MTERQALASRNIQMLVASLAYSNKFSTIWHRSFPQRHIGVIRIENRTYFYRIYNDVDADLIKLSIDMPIVCNVQTSNRVQKYLKYLNNIFHEQGVFSIDGRNRVTVRKNSSYTHYVPSFRTLEWEVTGLIILAGETYGVISAIAGEEHVPNNQKASSRVYYDIFLKDSIISKEIDTHELDKAFFSSSDYDFRDVDIEDDEWGTLFF